MNKRQKNKQLKKWLIKNGYPDKKVKLYCVECDNRLSLKNEYHKRYMVCNELCYMHSVGFSLSDFLWKNGGTAMNKQEIVLSEADIQSIINGREVIRKVADNTIVIRQSYLKDLIAPVLNDRFVVKDTNLTNNFFKGGALWINKK